MTLHKDSLSRVATINAPKVGDVDGIPLQVIASVKATFPIYVELTAENLTYLTRVCEFQMMIGQTKRIAKRARETRARADEVEVGEAVEDIVDVEAMEVEGSASALQCTPSPSSTEQLPQPVRIGRITSFCAPQRSKSMQDL